MFFYGKRVQGDWCWIRANWGMGEGISWGWFPARFIAVGECLRSIFDWSRDALLILKSEAGLGDNVCLMERMVCHLSLDDPLKSERRRIARSMARSVCADFVIQYLSGVV